MMVEWLASGHTTIMLLGRAICLRFREALEPRLNPHWHTAAATALFRKAIRSQSRAPVSITLDRHAALEEAKGTGIARRASLPESSRTSAGYSHGVENTWARLLWSFKVCYQVGKLPRSRESNGKRFQAAFDEELSEVVKPSSLRSQKRPLLAVLSICRLLRDNKRDLSTALREPSPNAIMCRVISQVHDCVCSYSNGGYTYFFAAEGTAAGIRVLCAKTSFQTACCFSRTADSSHF